MKRSLALLAAVSVAFTSALKAAGPVEFVEPAKPYDASPALKTPKGAVSNSGPIKMPIITWAADAATIDMNAGMNANPNSALARAAGRPVVLALENVVDEQVADYISGKSPFFRGTSGQIALIAGALKALDPDLEPITFVQLSRSTGADMFVAKNLPDLSALRHKTIITQLNGVHPEIIANILRDGGIDPTEVTLKYVRNISDPSWKPGKPAQDPANAFRLTPDAVGATMIDIDALAITGGPTAVGTGMDNTVKDAKVYFSTKTAPNIIFDCIAVRKDYLRTHPEVVENLRKALMDSHSSWKNSLTGLKTKPRSEKQKLVDRARPLAKILMDDPNLAGDLLVWMSEGADLADAADNAEFFKDSNPNGFATTTARVQEFYQKLGLISGPVKLTVNRPSGESASATVAPAATPVKKTFASVEAVRKAAESSNANVMFKFTFQFSPQESEINWKDYPQIFAKINETVTRYGGAIVQIRGHGDNFFYRFVRAKREAGETTYQKKDRVTGKFSEPIPLPDLPALANDSMKLSYTRAFNVKKAYSAYLRENLNLSNEDVDLSRFDIKGMGITQPVVENPKSADDRAKNMRCEVVIIAAESELPSELNSDDLR
jgi:outer membrane protein OmpA-like peptidoglycan-associated protein/ABC-type nitrate/sulfonate/bicarbonate transport system substrate-binding protein